jgi:hypothetical protein
MRLLLILSILSFCFILAKVNKKQISTSLYLAISSFLSPIVLFNQINSQVFILFIISLLLLVLIDLIKNKTIKKLFFTLTVIYFSLVILYLTGILNNNFKIDLQRLFVIDNLSLGTIKRFEQNALYLPRILRPVVYNDFQIIFITLTKVINYLWIDKIITYLGFAVIYLMYISIPKKKNKYYLLIPFVVILTSVLHRNPNNYFIYLFSLPALIPIFIKNITKFNKLILFILISISCLYSLL